MHGRGVETILGKEVYEGQFEQNVREGEGKLETREAIIRGTF